MMLLNRVGKWMKGNQILTLSLVGYLALFIFRQELSWVALQRSSYYFKEMIEILPAVFVLTSLIQTWIPTQVIVRNFGQGAGMRGSLISLAIGSLSAGPIYAAFPVCKMLLQKGASVKNILVILGSWAVVKVPMLINEVKFMGFQYMVVRWIFTIVAIYAMAYIMGKLTDEADLLVEDEETGVESLIDEQVCVGCGACVRVCPEVIQMEGKKAMVMATDLEPHRERLEKARQICPVNAFRNEAVVSA